MQIKTGISQEQSAFNNSLDSLKKLAIPAGGKFNDKTNLYVVEGMYNFSDLIKWADISIGASTKEYVLNSHGTIFADTAGVININETGGFAQIQKGFFDDYLKITAAGRYDKNSNFKGRFTPRITAVYEIAKNNYHPRILSDCLSFSFYTESIYQPANGISETDRWSASIYFLLWVNIKHLRHGGAWKFCENR